MKIEIQSNNDQFFTIQVKQMGEHVEATDGERSCIAKDVESAVEFFESLPAPEAPYRGPIAAPIENPRSNNFDLFVGTSWEGKKQPH